MATHPLPVVDAAVAASMVACVREVGAPFGLGDALPGVPEGFGRS